ncbi:uncharacterized protein F4822DRAFT_176966 [Hypoxylon trugodes]|uniref:uncharacterized protein n=1 Tax=Hypoxylon trugodes TaxID=326681 RepID=UPI0021A2354C|nr:uncharacterized protein F4822DRAFT_176966 [Hypoxylon trugodes]KAI1391181.1 hypothetical protein F4822DRAFT_176966 [Hypoxylon trugodes]
MPYVHSMHETETSISTIVGGTRQAPEPKKLILCFDGTGNTFTGSNADTNVVKILNNLDRNDPNQYHYYQTGIGTYDINETSVNKTWFGEMRSTISQVIDQGIGTTFDAHVMAGYRFLMRYYDPGDKIYMFGFSRGAFTAKFLARMINTVGLLCKGNEEMVLFAYRLYQRYLAGETDNFKKGTAKTATDEHEHETDPLLNHKDGMYHMHHRHRYEVARDEITAFSNTFCRKEQTIHCGKVEETNIKVYFLGIWDCVNSVAVLERKTPVPVPVRGTAHFVRHAVAVDERRVKFKAALLAQDIRASSHVHEDIKEVWFPGCHGDVGGGWPAAVDNPLDNREHMTIWQHIKNFWTTRKAKVPSKNVGTDPFQMSDIPLAWMIREVELVGQQDPSAAVKWCQSVHGFKQRFNEQKNKSQALKGFMHDSLRFGYGTGFFTVLLWKFLEYFPFITRWELDHEHNEWFHVRFPLNAANTRDIPPDAVLHESLLWRLRNDKSYQPRNNHGGPLPPCLTPEVKVEPIDDTERLDVTEHDGHGHKTFKIVKSNPSGEN